MEKSKKHIVFDHPILSMILMPVVLFAFITSVGDIVRALLGISSSHLISAVGEITAAVIVLALHQFWFRNELHHFFSAKNFGRGLLIGFGVMGVPLILLVMRIVSITLGETKIGNVGLALIYGLAPGIGEEVIFRIIPISIAMRSRNKNVITIVLVVTSLIFGLGHSVNLLAGADPMQTLLQVIYATALGLTFAAIYLRTGNIWITIFIHTLTDFTSYIALDTQEAGGVLADKAEMATIIGLSVLSVIFFINALIAFRKSQREKIPAVWDRIWGREAIAEDVA